jgi:putative tryptophan/tyrosine transport system substrate-binding protein
MRRRDFVTLLSGAAAWPFAARAEQATMPVIGILGASSGSENAPYTAAFLRGLTEQGFVEGRNLLVEYRWADGRYNQLPSLAAELVRQQVTVIFASGGQSPLRAAMAATKSIPIVFSLASDPVGRGYVASLSRPGGNVTGMNFLAEDVAGKRFELLRKLLPKAATTALLVNLGSPTSEAERRVIEAAAREVGQKVLVLTVGSARDIEVAFATLVESHADALLVTVDPLLLQQREQIVTLAARHAIPVVGFEREFVTAGALMSYGTPLRNSYHQAGIYVGRILKGAKPSDLPIVQATSFELVINLKTAQSLGVTVPQTLIAIADEVIE